MELKDLKQDKRNYRKHNDRNISLIRKSVDECGLGRSIVVDKNNEIVAGNGLVSSISKNTKIKVIETDGSELVVVKRTDLDTDDVRRKKLAVMDNSTSDSSEFDMALLSIDFDNSSLQDMGVDMSVGEVDSMDVEEEKEDKYRIVYEIVFNNEDEQSRWFNFISALKSKYKDVNTITERIMIIVDDWLAKNE